MSHVEVKLQRNLTALEAIAATTTDSGLIVFPKDEDSVIFGGQRVGVGTNYMFSATEVWVNRTNPILNSSFIFKIHRLVDNLNCYLLLKTSNNSTIIKLSNSWSTGDTDFGAYTSASLQDIGITLNLVASKRPLDCQAGTILRVKPTYMSGASWTLAGIAFTDASYSSWSAIPNQFKCTL